MKPGLRTNPPVGRIDYKQLRKINPEAARKAVVEYLKTNGHNISQTALVFGVNRAVVYDIVGKDRESDLKEHEGIYCAGTGRELAIPLAHIG